MKDIEVDDMMKSGLKCFGFSLPTTSILLFPLLTFRQMVRDPLAIFEQCFPISSSTCECREYNHLHLAHLIKSLRKTARLPSMHLSACFACRPASDPHEYGDVNRKHHHSFKENCRRVFITFYCRRVSTCNMSSSVQREGTLVNS